MKFLTNALRLAVALAIAAGAVDAPVSAQTPTATRTFHRQLKVYFGTWIVFVQGNPSPISSQTFVELTDHISDGLRLTVQADMAVDSRVKSAVALWVNPPNLTNIDWVVGAPENLPAIANFNGAIAALGGSITTDSGFLPPSVATYMLDSADTTEIAPVLVGDPNDMLFGAPGQTVTITNRFVADVSYIERNGTVTLPAVFKCPLGHGYWKNNLNLWPITPLPLGVLNYTKPELSALLSSPSVKDGSIILARQLIATKLNLLYGSAAAPISATVSQADALIGSNHLPFNVPPSSSTGKAMTAAASILDNYNNGKLTAVCVP